MNAPSQCSIKLHPPFFIKPRGKTGITLSFLRGPVHFKPSMWFPFRWGWTNMRIHSSGTGLMQTPLWLSGIRVLSLLSNRSHNFLDLASSLVHSCAVSSLVILLSCCWLHYTYIFEKRVLLEPIWHQPCLVLLHSNMAFILFDDLHFAHWGCLRA